MFDDFNYNDKVGFKHIIDGKVMFIEFADVKLDNFAQCCEFERMYKKYIDELSQYDDNNEKYVPYSWKKDAEEYPNVIVTRFLLHKVKSYPIMKEEIIPIGFIMSQESYDTDIFYISQFYIEPEYRRKQIGSTIAELFTNIKGKERKILYHVCMRNETAEAFWKKVMKECQMQDDKDTCEDYESFPGYTKYVKTKRGRK